MLFNTFSSYVPPLLSIAFGFVHSLPQDNTPFVAEADGPTGCSTDFNGQLGLSYQLSGLNLRFAPGTCSLTTTSAKLATLKAGAISMEGPDGQTSRLIVTKDGYIKEDEGIIPDARIASTDGFSLCDDGSIAYQGSAGFWGCLKPDGNSMLLWLEDQGDCSPYQVKAIPCT